MYDWSVGHKNKITYMYYKTMIVRLLCKYNVHCIRYRLSGPEHSNATANNSRLPYVTGPIRFQTNNSRIRQIFFYDAPVNSA